MGILVAGAATGWVIAGARAAWIRGVGLVAGGLTPALIGILGQAPLAALFPDAGWFRDEAVLLLIGLIPLALGVGAIAAGALRQREAGQTAT